MGLSLLRPGFESRPGRTTFGSNPYYLYIDYKNNKEHIINSETTATISIVQQQQKNDNTIIFGINHNNQNSLKIRFIEQ